MMISRSASVMASIWSWVTNTEVTPRLAVQAAHFGAHGDAQLGIEVGERLVEQEHLGLAHHGAGHGDALALAAGKLARLAVEIGLERHRLGDLHHPARRARPCGTPATFSA